MDLNYICKTTKVLETYRKERFLDKYMGCEDEVLREVCFYIANVLLMWTGETLVGVKKDTKTEQIFQKFFIAIKKLIDTFLSNKKHLSALENDFISSIKYQGNIYRYIGTKKPNKKESSLMPHDSKIYVSWSKQFGNTYLLSKLPGKCTLLSCTIAGYNYGIDIQGFNDFFNKFQTIHIAKGDEQEVVFPTILNIIKCEIIRP